MTVEPNDLRDLAAAYALNALEPDERREFEERLATSPELQREVAEYREVGALLALHAGDEAPGAELWQRIEQRLDDTAAANGRDVIPLSRARRASSTLAWAAAVAGLVVAGGLWLRGRDLARDSARLNATVDTVRTELAARDALLDQVLGDNTAVFTLTSAAVPEPRVRVFWNRDTNIWVFRASNLLQLDPSETYQLWFIRDGNVIPSVTFNADAAGQALVTVAGPAETAGLSAAAVSREPAGGSQVPTEVLLIGNVADE